MDSSSHLEKMGRELKCPIRLSLLNSAISLTCNHVFCNECIQKSMKLALDCPVCKVPYRRREVRPAPHMDNLVNIYKSMEVVSGANIFVSQSIPSKKLSGEENQPESGEVHRKGQTCRKPVKQRKLKENRSKGYLSKKSSSDTMRPSFPAIEDTVMDTPQDVPCFNDLKDADDELQCNMNPKVYVIDATNPQCGLHRVHIRIPGVQYFLEHHRGFFYALTNQLPCGNNLLSTGNYYLIRCRV